MVGKSTRQFKLFDPGIFGNSFGVSEDSSDDNCTGKCEKIAVSIYEDYHVIYLAENSKIEECQVDHFGVLAEWKSNAEKKLIILLFLLKVRENVRLSQRYCEMESEKVSDRVDHKSRWLLHHNISPHFFKCSNGMRVLSDNCPLPVGHPKLVEYFLDLQLVAYAISCYPVSLSDKMEKETCGGIIFCGAQVKENCCYVLTKKLYRSWDEIASVFKGGTWFLDEKWDLLLENILFMLISSLRISLKLRKRDFYESKGVMIILEIIILGAFCVVVILGSTEVVEKGENIVRKFEVLKMYLRPAAYVQVGGNRSHQLVRKRNEFIYGTSFLMVLSDYSFAWYFEGWPLWCYSNSLVRDRVWMGYSKVNSKNWIADSSMLVVKEKCPEVFFPVKFFKFVGSRDGNNDIKQVLLERLKALDEKLKVLGPIVKEERNYGDKLRITAVVHMEKNCVDSLKCDGKEMLDGFCSVSGFHSHGNIFKSRPIRFKLGAKILLGDKKKDLVIVARVGYHFVVNFLMMAWRKSLMLLLYLEVFQSLSLAELKMCIYSEVLNMGICSLRSSCHFRRRELAFLSEGQESASGIEAETIVDHFVSISVMAEFSGIKSTNFVMTNSEEQQQYETLEKQQYIWKDSVTIYSKAQLYGMMAGFWCKYSTFSNQTKYREKGSRFSGNFGQHPGKFRLHNGHSCSAKTWSRISGKYKQHSGRFLQQRGQFCCAGKWSKNSGSGNLYG